MAIRHRRAGTGDITEIRELLDAAHLPTEDVAEHITDFFVAETGGRIIGVGGLENCGEGVGLLRSFVVAPEYRNQGIGRQLHGELVEHSRRLGISSLYLLTVSASGYFSRLGFAPVDRASAPPAIQRTHQFSASCPSSAVLMRSSIG